MAEILHKYFQMHFIESKFLYFDKNFTEVCSQVSMIRAGASTRFTSMSTSMSTCNVCEYEYEYLIITWIQVRVLVYDLYSM